MRPSLTVSRQAVGLDWRLLHRAMRGSGSDLMLPALVGALVLARASESALTTAAVITGRPAGVVAGVVSAFVWNTCLAAVVLSLAASGHPITERIVRYLASEPVTRRQTHVALVLLSVAGRHALVSGLALVPLICLLTALVEPARAFGGGLATLVVVRLVPGVTRCVTALAVYATRPAVAAAIGASGVVALVAGPGLDAAVAALPPTLVAEYIAGSRTSPSLWLLLAAWTAAIGILEHATLFRSPTAPAQPRRPPVLSATPAWARALAQLVRLPAPLLHAELIRLIRWRRFWLGWVLYAAVLALAVTRMPALDTRILPVLLLALLPSLVLMATLGNLLAPDRAGAQAYYVTLDEPHAAIRAKLVALAVYVAIAEAISLGPVLLVVEKEWRVADLYSPLMAVAFFIYTASTGRIVSTLFPAPTDPRGVGGTLLKGPGAVVLLPLNALGLVAVAGPALSHDTRGIGAPGLLIAGIIVCALVAGGALLSSRISRRAMSVRREELLARLSQESALS